MPVVSADDAKCSTGCHSSRRDLVADLEHGGTIGRKDRPALQCEPLSRGAVGDPEYLVVDGLGVDGADGAADRGRADGGYLRGRRVLGLIGHGGHDLAAQPAGPLQRDERSPVRGGDVQEDIA